MKATYIVNQESVLTALMTMLKANWKEYLKRKFLPCIELPGGAIMAHPTHKLDYEPAQDFIRNIEAYAVELGVILPEYRSF